MAQLGGHAGAGRRGRRRLRRVPRLARGATASTATTSTSRRSSTPPASSARPTTRCARSARSTPARWASRADIEIAPDLGRRRRRPRRHQRLRPGGDGQAQRRVPRAGACASSPTRRSRSPAWTAPQLHDLIEGADLLFTNDYEREPARVQDRAVRRPTSTPWSTSGSPRSARKGVEIVGRDFGTVHVPVAKERAKADPTGVGDAFRGGVPDRPRLGPVVGARGPGRQPARDAWCSRRSARRSTRSRRTSSADRLAESYGDECAAEVLPYLG